ncbi:MAG: SUMF1/EgtB/PvdO family nonheme iron enzyme [Cyanobacteria bacterium P01_C01_bin.120]
MTTHSCIVSCGVGNQKRGGSWNNNPRNCRSAYRNRNTPDNTNNNIGFRVVCSAPSTLLLPITAGQNWQMGICRACLRRVQTYSGDAVEVSKNQPGSAILVGQPKT